MKIKRNIVQIDRELCDGCGQCLTVCDPWALKIVNGKVRLVDEKLCSGKGICAKVCPAGALSIIARKAERYNRYEVDNYLQSLLLQPLYVDVY